MVTEDGHSEAEGRRRTLAGANGYGGWAFRGRTATSDSSGSECLEKGKPSPVGQKKLKGKVMRTCVTPACLYVLETVALTEQQQHKLQVCGNNWVR